MKSHWPTEEEIQQLQKLEDQRAREFNEESDPICECGEPGWCCCCEELAEKLGYWWDGSEYDNA